MLAEKLPKCLCGAHNYQGGGGCIGGEISYTNFICGTCQRNVFILEERVPILLTETYQRFRDTSHWPTVMYNYINGPLMSAIRAAKETKSPPIPPQLPDELTAYRMTDNQERGWVLFDRDICRQTPVPKDPIRVHHDEFWDELLTKMDLKNCVIEVPNRYYDDHLNLEPWFEFTAPGGQVIRFGPRKRVLAIQVTSEKPFLCEGIAKAAKLDNVTFEADGRWQPWDTEEAKSIEVHAWNEESFTAYFGWIMWDLGRTAGTELKESRPLTGQGQELTSMGIIDNLTPEKFEATRAKAEEKGFEVVMGHDQLLLLDLDGEAAQARFHEQLELVNRMFGVDGYQKWASKSGGDHQHVLVYLKTPATLQERVAIQAAMGSDPIREILTLIRARNGIVEPSRLFRPKKPIT
jgi:hypothetical protein